MKDEVILILDFGGQYKELIARRVRECGVYSIIRPHTISMDEIRKLSPMGIIFTGGPNSVYADKAPTIDKEILELGIPVLGICYGMQLLGKLMGGTIAPCSKSEYGVLPCSLNTSFPLFEGCNTNGKVLMSHTDMVTVLPQSCISTASTELCANAAFSCESRNIYGVQFHPEVENTFEGTKILNNFLYTICKVSGGYSMDNYLSVAIERVRKQVGTGRILLGLSGGVDSAVCAALLAKAVPDRLTCIYVDHGFMRKNETQEIQEAFSKFDLKLICIDAKKRFLDKLSGVTEPETKRKLIGKEFASTFEEAAKSLGNIEYLAQGTIYPDVVESGTDAAVIKSHHNVGGLPADLGFLGVVEPLRYLFKDEVRKLGKLLGLPSAIVERQPFPGPGLSIRIIGEITQPKLDILKEADAILRYEISKLDVKPDQYFVVLTNTRSVGVMGDGRTYEYTAALRAVKTNDFMTCAVSDIPFETLIRISNRITNEVKGINRVVFDITSKPPATIEWE